jgi:ABC-type dipeptide/oligopeptide/nickel transport system ATPase subunit
MIDISHLTKRIGCQLILDDLSLTLHKGEIVGLMGKSGGGKSTFGKILLGLMKPDRGTILFNEEPIQGLHPKKMQMVFQDPYSSLNPRMKIGSILEEPTRIHHLPSRVDELLDLVKLPAEMKHRYPHELSGGQRQRVAIARAIALNPPFLICDEPLSSLDISIQAQIARLLVDLQRTLSLTILFISHDRRMVEWISTRIFTLTRGKMEPYLSGELKLNYLMGL